jgi:hypothetical protein
MPSPLDNPYAPPGARGGEPPILAQPVEESESVVRVDYHLTLEDLVEYNFYYQCHSASMRRRWRLLRGVGLAGIALAALLMFYGYLTQQDVGVALIGFPAAAFGIVILYASLPSRRKAALRGVLKGMLREGRNENLFSLHRVWISPTGIRRISRFADTTYQWPAIEKIGVGPGGAYIYDSTASAIVVPRSAFASDGEFQHFVETAEQFWKQASI